MDLKTYLSEKRGRASALARAIAVSPVTVHQWAGGKQVPSDRCPQIEAWTSGAVTCEELRPDLCDWWVVLRGPATRSTATEQERAA